MTVSRIWCTMLTTTFFYKKLTKRVLIFLILKRNLVFLIFFYESHIISKANVQSFSLNWSWRTSKRRAESSWDQTITKGDNDNRVLEGFWAQVFSFYRFSTSLILFQYILTIQLFIFSNFQDIFIIDKTIVIMRVQLKIIIKNIANVIK